MFILLGKANRQRCLLQKKAQNRESKEEENSGRQKSHHINSKTRLSTEGQTLETGSNSNDKYGFMAERGRTKRLNSTYVANRTTLGRAFHNRKARLIKLLIPNLVLERGGITPRVAACLVEPSAGDSRLQTAGTLRSCVHWYAAMASFAQHRSSRGVIFHLSYKDSQSSV